MSKRNASVLFVAKHGDEHVDRALDFCRRNFTSVTAYLGRWGDKLPAEAWDWRGEYVISYLSRWILNDDFLKKPTLAAINFHPAPPEYPGVGCTNFALYEAVAEYGSTCHHMAARVDTGKIIAVKRFPLLPSDDVESLIRRTYDHQLSLFYDMVTLMVQGEPFPESAERWSRKPFTRRQLDDLAKVTADMSREEIARRVRATTFGPWKTTMEVNGVVFEVKTPAAGG